jgi:membrane protease YdiL (CAAX protease family)
VTQGQQAGLPPLTRRLLGWEIVIVFGVSLGASALFAVIQLIGSLTAAKPLGRQQALLVGSLAPGRPWLDLSLQLANVLVALAPVALVFYLLVREGTGPSAAMGLDAEHPAQDATRGAILAALIGGSGLGLYLAAFHLGMSLNVVPESLPAVWWRVPVLILDAAHNGIVEEVLVVGYLLRRLDQLHWTPARAIALSAVLRGSYHLYQGFGGFLGNATMGVIFAVLYRRWGRVTPLIVAHTLIDSVAFVGYAALHGHVSWLP